MSISFNMVANGSVPASGATPGSQYFELNGSGTGFKSYLTNSAGVPIAQEAINAAQADTLIQAALADFDGPVIVADIATRDALTLTRNAVVYVTNATADALVDSGAATYLYNEGADTYTLVSEFESLNVPPLDYVTQDW